jgi:XTP/dITP diphosphohydrolase
VRAHVELFLASSNPGKLDEFRTLARTTETSLPVRLKLLEGFDSLLPFEEKAPTFGENALGKALHYSRLCAGYVVADDSGLVVPVLGGAPGVHSARYAGVESSSAGRNAKLLRELQGKTGEERAGYFVCAIALAKAGRAIAVVTDRVDGEILEAVRGGGGFGYDPVFYFPPLRKTLAELSATEKNQHSHRGKAFRRLLSSLPAML